MKALIKVGYACNENCTFCHTADMRHIDDTSDRVAWKIDRAKRLGYSMVVLSGGEPTLRPELLAWARRVASMGLDFGLVTNGLLLSYPHVTDELIERCRLRYVYMSMHGGTKAVHRSVVRADTFDQAMGAVKLLHARVPDLTVNCVITTANVDHLRSFVDALLPFPDLTIKLSMTQPKGAASNDKKAFDVIMPLVERCADRVQDAIDYGLSKVPLGAKGPRFAHDGVPFCLLPGHEARYDDLKTHRFAAMIEVDEDDFVPVDDVAKVHTDRCAPCSIKGACPGLYRGYHEVYGDAALKPVTGRPRANSFNYTPLRDVMRPKGAPCPIKADGTTPYDRGRTLFLRLPDRMRLLKTESRDFTDHEILTAKEALGQVYADVSKKLAPDDFSKDLVKLRPSAECAACEARPRCAGAWEPVRGDVFGRDDARVMDILRSLEGRVLDLGGGEGRYVEALAPKAIAKQIDYLCVDPDQERLDVLAARHGFAKTLAAKAEELPSAVGEVDHVLVLRSYNHLASPKAVIAKALSLLREGGTLTIADNIAFGLVRSQEHAARAERAKENLFEHLRNDGAAEAHACVTEVITGPRDDHKTLVLTERRDVGPETSNQWLLRYTCGARSSSAGA